MNKRPLKARSIFHKWSISRLSKFWFWKGFVICRLLGHKIPDTVEDHCCGRCSLSFEEIYPRYWLRIIKAANDPELMVEIPPVDNSKSRLFCKEYSKWSNTPAWTEIFKYIDSEK